MDTKPSLVQLDLKGITWPVCLLTFKQTLLTLVSGERLEVVIHDPEVAEQILMIVERSPDRIIDRHMEGKKLRLRIEKGKKADPGKMISCGIGSVAVGE